MSDTDFLTGDRHLDKMPSWFPVWGAEHAYLLDIDVILMEDVDEQDEIFRDVGKAFINAVNNFLYHDNNKPYFALETYLGRATYKRLTREINKSYMEYDKRVENGKKGGRPRKESEGKEE